MSKPTPNPGSGSGVPPKHEIERTSGGQANADRAAEVPTGETKDPKRHQEELLDEAIEETFPASDPISPKRITRAGIRPIGSSQSCAGMQSSLGLALDKSRIWRLAAAAVPLVKSAVRVVGPRQDECR